MVRMYPTLAPAALAFSPTCILVSDLHRGVGETFLPLIHQHRLLGPCVPDQDLHIQRHKTKWCGDSAHSVTLWPLPHPASITSAPSLPTFAPFS